jgi:hypothetical protein
MRVAVAMDFLISSRFGAAFWGAVSKKRLNGFFKHLIHEKWRSIRFVAVGFRAGATVRVEVYGKRGVDAAEDYRGGGTDL